PAGFPQRRGHPCRCLHKTAEVVAREGGRPDAHFCGTPQEGQAAPSRVGVVSNCEKPTPPGTPLDRRRGLHDESATTKRATWRRVLRKDPRGAEGRSDEARPCPLVSGSTGRLGTLGNRGERRRDARD